MSRSLIAAALTLVALTTSAEARHRHRTAPALDPACNIIMPCEEMPAPDPREARRRARGLQLEREVPFGRAVRPYGLAAPGTDLVAAARAYMGQTAAQIGLHRTTLWCATFLNHVLARAGYRGTGSDAARSFAAIGHRLPGPEVGAIAVLSRRGGGHVGVVSGIDAAGNPIVVSGNHGHRVGEGVYSRARVVAYVAPAAAL